MRQAGSLTVKEMAQILAVSEGNVNIRKNQGMLAAHACNDRDQELIGTPW
jgi:DNA-directed RNA polymerase specialized sigma24 family protein